MSTTSLPSLPAELLHEIASQVDDAPTLASLSLASNAWNIASTKCLYQLDVDITFKLDEKRMPDDTWSKPCQLARTMLARPDLAALITGVRVEVLPARFPAASFDRRYNEEAAVADLLNRILANGSSIIALTFVATGNWTTLGILQELVSRSDLFARLRWFKAEKVEFDIADTLILAMPSLLHLHIGTLNLTTGTRTSATIPPFALRSLVVERMLSGSDVNLLAQSSNRTSLRSVDFKADDEDPPDWTPFPKLNTVSVTFDDLAEYGQTATSLATCIVAERITIRLPPYRKLPACALESHQILQSLPSSLVSLDVSPIKERLSEYVLDWLRDGDTQWPNLRWVKMRGIDKKEDDETVPLIMRSHYEELKRVRLACEEVGERKGIEFEWTEC